MKILVINPGEISTRVSVFFEENEITKETIEHSTGELSVFGHAVEQKEFRKNIILKWLKSKGYELTDFSAVCGRGGLLRHIPSGTYKINDKALYDAQNCVYGEHSSNLGIILAKELGDMAGIPSYFTDPVSMDELSDIARISGLKGIERESFFHALNQKQMAKKASELIGIDYEELNLIVVHMGGTVSVAAHSKGKVVDVFNVRDEGGFSADRAGTLPTSGIVNLCFSGKTKEEVKRLLGSEAGIFSYLGTRSLKEVEKRAFSKDNNAKLVFDALVYQHSKDIGAMAAALKFDVDAIVLTGGMANSKRLCREIEEYVGWIARVIVLPGEEEMRSLALGALRVMHGAGAMEY